MACPVCFGGEDTVMRESLNAGIGVLMGVTTIVLAGFARLIVVLARRSREASQRPPRRRTRQRGCALMLAVARPSRRGLGARGEVDRIMVLIHWLMLVLFVGWSIFFVYVLMRFRRGAHPQANYRGVKGSWSTWIEGGVLVAEIVLLAFFSIPFWRANVDAMPPSSGATTVRVVAEQFAWHVHYPGPDGVFGRTDITLVTPDNPLGLDRNEPVGKDDIIATNRMNLPVGKPVVIFLSSKDVIHSFGLPQMRVKQDAIPGIVQPVWFTPTKIGEWDIACSQLCGLGHFRMKGIYAIQTQAAYDAWLKEEAEFLTNP